MAGLSLSAAGIDVVLLDIEGTTTPIAFVHDVLFPYARARVRTYLEEMTASDTGLRQIVADLRRELPASGFPLTADVSASPREDLRVGSSPSQDADIVSYVYWLMDRDRKSGPLKALQGRIWEEGYVTGALTGEVYPDVRDAFHRWTESGRRIAIFSSGSVLAQQLLFGRSSAGDLSPFLSGYFDTAVGAKDEPESYRRIVAALSVHPPRTLFVSDVVKELDAARAAGLRTLLCVRPPAPPPAGGHEHEIVGSLDAIAV